MKYEVEQLVNCQVRVKYTITAITHEHALAIVANNNVPTSVDGCDYEIVSDINTESTIVKSLEE